MSPREQLAAIIGGILVYAVLWLIFQASLWLAWKRDRERIDQELMHKWLDINKKIAAHRESLRQAQRSADSSNGYEQKKGSQETAQKRLNGPLNQEQGGDR